MRSTYQVGCCVDKASIKLPLFTLDVCIVKRSHLLWPTWHLRVKKWQHSVPACMQGVYLH